MALDTVQAQLFSNTPCIHLDTNCHCFLLTSLSSDWLNGGSALTVGQAANNKKNKEPNQEVTHMSSMPSFQNLVEMVQQKSIVRNQSTFAYFVKDNGERGDQCSYAELDNQARAIAMELVQRGLSGRNLMLLFSPSIDYVRAFFGCLYAGCVAVPAYPPTGARDLSRLQKVAMDCNAGAILTNKAMTSVVDTWITSLGYEDQLSSLAVDQFFHTPVDPGFEPYQAAPDDVAFLQYTSGSTGHPKGVEVTHGNLLANFDQILHCFIGGNDWLENAHDLRAAIWLPPFHDMGLIGGILTPIYAGAQVSLMSPLTFLKRPLVWLKTMSDQKAHVSGGPNFGYQYCVRRVSEEKAEQLDLSNWRVAFNGAEPIQTGALNAFSERFAVSGFNPRAFLPCYGLAEASLFVTGMPNGKGARVLPAQLDEIAKGRFKPATESDRTAEGSSNTIDLVSSGVVAQGAEVKIVDPRSCLPCADGEVGEIWINSPSVARGYWGKPQFSASVFNAKLGDGSSATEYLRSGDLGFMHKGELYVTGRIKEVIIIAGRNHYPQDIERTLQDVNPSFRGGGGAAFAITQDGREELVVLQEVDKAAGDQGDYRMLAASGAQAITARHGVTPAALVLVSGSAIPKTSSGKIQRGEAKQLYQQGNLVPVYVWQPGSGTKASSSSKPAQKIEHYDMDDWRSQLYVELQEWVADKLDVEPHHIDLDVSFSELGVDSVEAVELVDRLQDRVGRVIPAIELLRYPTVKALIDHFAQDVEKRSLEQVD